MRTVRDSVQSVACRTGPKGWMYPINMCSWLNEQRVVRELQIASPANLKSTAAEVIIALRIFWRHWSVLEQFSSFSSAEDRVDPTVRCTRHSNSRKLRDANAVTQTSSTWFAQIRGKRERSSPIPENHSIWNWKPTPFAMSTICMIWIAWPKQERLLYCAGWRRTWTVRKEKDS